MQTYRKGWKIKAERTESWDSSFKGTHLTISKIRTGGEYEFLYCSWFNGKVSEAFKYGKGLVDKYEQPIKEKLAEDHELFSRTEWKYDLEQDILSFYDENLKGWARVDDGELRSRHDAWRISQSLNS
jgi:hypothetical protein